MTVAAAIRFSLALAIIAGLIAAAYPGDPAGAWYYDSKVYLRSTYDPAYGRPPVYPAVLGILGRNVVYYQTIFAVLSFCLVGYVLAGFPGLILLAFHGWSLLPDRGAASVGLFWLLGEILFFTYYAPWDGAPFGAAASVPLWGTLFVCLGGIRGRAEAIAAYCLALAVILYVHNTKTLAILGGIIP